MHERLDDRTSPGRQGQPAFALLVVLVALAAFTWPVLAAPGSVTGLVVLFVAWALTVAALAFVGRGLGSAPPSSGEVDD